MIVSHKIKTLTRKKIIIVIRYYILNNIYNPQAYYLIKPATST